MMQNKSLTIYELKKEYEYKIDPLDFLETAYVKYGLFYGHIANKIDEYKFDKNIKEIEKIIKNKGDTIPKNIIESFEKTLKDILIGCEEIKKNIDLEYDENSSIIGNVSLDYENNKNKPGAAEVYLKISKEIIDNEVKKFIEYEKKLISFNENIINIKKYLTN